MKILLATTFALACSLPVHAQDAPHSKLLVASYATLVAGNAADVWSTEHVLATGGHESNTTLNGSSLGRIVATKAITVGATAVLMTVLTKSGHPKIAAVFGFGSGGIGFAAAAHNVTQR